MKVLGRLELLARVRAVAPMLCPYCGDEERAKRADGKPGRLEHCGDRGCAKAYKRLRKRDERTAQYAEAGREVRRRDDGPRRAA